MSGIASTQTIERSDLELAAEGDHAAFARLVALHYDDMARVAYIITGDRSFAQDAVQSAKSFSVNISGDDSILYLPSSDGAAFHTWSGPPTSSSAP